MIVPLDAPGMPHPGPDLLRLAQALGDDSREVKAKVPAGPGGRAKTVRRVEAGAVLERVVWRALYEPGFQLPVQIRPGDVQEMRLVPGHVWGQYLDEHFRGGDEAPLPDGPRPAKVMVVGSMPGPDEAEAGRHMLGEGGELFVDVCNTLRIKGTARWYVTSVIRFRPPEGAPDTRSSWVEMGKHLLAHEIRLVRPDFILCLGALAVKTLLGKEMTVAKLDGLAAEYHYETGYDDDDVRTKTARVMAVLHPFQVVRDSTQRRALERGMARFRDLIKGKPPSPVEEGLDHRVIDRLEALEALLREIDADPGRSPVVACDAEWHGDHPCNAGSYLRTFQFSWKPKSAACVTLRGKGGGIAFYDAAGKPAGRRAVKLLARWFEGRRVVGHFFNADLEWLVHEGLDLRRQFDVPRYDADDGRTAWMRTRDEGGADTGLMCHAIEETGDFGLEALCNRYLDGVPRYDLPMAEWCKQQKADFGVLEGYGEAPDELLLPYSAYDADVTIRLWHALDPLLDCDFEGNCCREAFWESMYAAPAVLEIHRTGIAVDKERIDYLTEVFLEGRDAVEADLKSDKGANWPDCNVRSPFHVREFLFGEGLNGKFDADGRCQRIRPEGARSLYLTPILDTSKPPKLWEDLVFEGKTVGRTPSTNKTSLPLLIQEAGDEETKARIELVRNYRILDQVLKSVLRPPRSDDEGVWLRDEDMGLIFDAGLGACICDDGKIRTHIYQTKETGRWSSARPPLQNISKNQDVRYKALLGGKYKYPLRSILRASPGHVLVECDYKGAELYGMAVMAGDDRMIEHAQRALFPDEGFDERGEPSPGGKFPHPEYYDIHSNVAVLAFQLDCPPTKAGLDGIGKKRLRNIAKCVVAGSRLHTDRGLLRVEELVGDLPADSGALPAAAWRVANHKTITPVVGVYNGGVKPCVRVETELGYRLESTAEHRYWVMGPGGDMTFRRAAELRPGDWAAVRCGHGPFGDDAAFPAIAGERRASFRPAGLPAVFNEDWAAFLGLYVAGGSADPVSGTVQVCLADEVDPEFADVAEGVMRRLFGERLTVATASCAERRDRRRFAVSSVELARWLAARCPGCSRGRRLPDFVFRWPERLARTLLAWLFEGDGGAYATCSEGLARDVQCLLGLFGVLATVASETREGCDNPHWAVTVFSSESRERFVERIGFVTAVGRDRGVDGAAFRGDRRVIPGQEARLRALLPHVPSPLKERCRECLRSRRRVGLDPTRLGLILDALPDVLPPEAEAARRALAELLSWDVSFQEIRVVEDVGARQVYDVQTTDEFGHLVSYNNILTHQTVIFGIAYGRGAKAIALAAREEGVNISVEEAQGIIDAIFRLYPGLVPFFEECEGRAVSERWLCHCFGRLRRFPYTRDKKLRGEFERQAKNFPIQGMIASAVSRAIGHLARYRDDVGRPDLYRILLQIHDAILLEVPYAYVDFVASRVIPHCMRDLVPLYPTTLDGVPTGKGPYYLGFDTEVAEHWGIPVGANRCRELGIPDHYGKGH